MPQTPLTSGFDPRLEVFLTLPLTLLPRRKNVPAPLREHAILPHVSAEAIYKVGLGRDGKFWLGCKEGNKSAHLSL